MLEVSLVLELKAFPVHHSSSSIGFVFFKVSPVFDFIRFEKTTAPHFIVYEIPLVKVAIFEEEFPLPSSSVCSEIAHISVTVFLNEFTLPMHEVLIQISRVSVSILELFLPLDEVRIRALI
jgi:hypothetical protein